MKNLKDWFKNFKFKEKWGELLVVVSPIIFSIMFGISQIKDFLGINWFVFLIFIFSIITIIGWLFNIANNESASNLLVENIKLKDQKEHVENVLGSLPEEACKLLIKKWELGGDSRITIYMFDLEEGFIPVSRSSRNPEYDSVNRKSYPKRVGYISRCWMVDKGEYFYDLPDPKLNQSKYIDYVNSETGMLKKDLRDLTMKSRSYYGTTLYNNSKAFLMIMVESIDPKIKNIEIIKQDLEGTMSEFIISTVNSNITPRGGKS